MQMPVMEHVNVLRKTMKEILDRKVHIFCKTVHRARAKIQAVPLCRLALRAVKFWIRGIRSMDFRKIFHAPLCGTFPSRLATVPRS